jgi:hypothetical protein
MPTTPNLPDAPRFSVPMPAFTVTGDRHEFIGRNGNLQRPQAMGKTRLSGKTGAGFDPCAAIQIAFELAPGQTRNIVFTLGLADQKQQTAQQLIAQLRGSHAADEALIRVHQHWADTLNMVQVTTPDKTLNILANGWLPYQMHRLPLVGRAAAFISLVARLASAINCRIRWRSHIRHINWRAIRFYCRLRTNSLKAMSCTGGIRRHKEGAYPLFR